MSLFLKEMKGGRISPNVNTYSAVISACEERGQVEEVLRMFSELRQWHKPVAMLAKKSSNLFGGRYFGR